MCVVDACLTMDTFTLIHAFCLHFIAPLHKYSPHRHFFQVVFKVVLFLVVFIHTHHCKLDPCCTLYCCSYTRYSIHYIATFLSQFSILARSINNFVPDCTLYVSAIYNIDHAIELIDLQLHGFGITLTIYNVVYISISIYIYICLREATIHH